MAGLQKKKNGEKEINCDEISSSQMLTLKGMVNLNLIYVGFLSNNSVVGFSIGSLEMTKMDEINEALV